MNRYRVGISAAVLGLFLLGAPADAQQVYVRNKPYKGVVSSVSGQVWVDLQGLADALEVKVQTSEAGGWAVSRAPVSAEQLAQVGAGQVMIEGKPVESQAGENGAVLVPLKTAAELLGARVVNNKSMGTIDVSLAAKKGAAPVGPVVKTINSPGQAVDVVSNLVPGRTNIVEFTAPW